MRAMSCRCSWPSRRPTGRSSWRESPTWMLAYRHALGQSDRSSARLRWTMPFRSRFGATTICGIWFRRTPRSICPNRTSCRPLNCWSSARPGLWSPGAFCGTDCPKRLIVRRNAWLASRYPRQVPGQRSCSLGFARQSSSPRCSGAWSGGRSISPSP